MQHEGVQTDSAGLSLILCALQIYLLTSDHPTPGSVSLNKSSTSKQADQSCASSQPTEHKEQIQDIDDGAKWRRRGIGSGGGREVSDEMIGCGEVSYSQEEGSKYFIFMWKWSVLVHIIGMRNNANL